jgi:hypothetical protein
MLNLTDSFSVELSESHSQQLHVKERHRYQHGQHGEMRELVLQAIGS